MTSLLEKKFDSTGFFLERDFDLVTDKQVLAKQQGEKNGKMEKDGKASFYDTIALGKLCRMKDGSLKMKIGENFFDLIDGVQNNFYKELFSIDFEKQTAMNLFPIEKKFIIKPDIESFLL